MIRATTPAAGDNSVNSGHLRVFVERIERMDEDIASLNADKSKIFKEARGEGFDVKALRIVLRRRRMDPDKRAEIDSLVDLYQSSLG